MQKALVEWRYPLDSIKSTGGDSVKTSFSKLTVIHLPRKSTVTICLLLPTGDHCARCASRPAECTRAKQMQIAAIVGARSFYLLLAQ